ncbi:unnamed protein product, partial [Tetraodon nigroviridis]
RERERKRRRSRSASPACRGEKRRSREKRSRSRDRKSRDRRSSSRDHKKRRADLSCPCSHSPKRSREETGVQVLGRPPPGFEHITPLQYKAMQGLPSVSLWPPAAGQIPNYGAAGHGRQRGRGGAPTPVPVAGSQMTRQARRLYVGNNPFGLTEVRRGRRPPAGAGAQAALLSSGVHGRVLQRADAAGGTFAGSQQPGPGGADQPGQELCLPGGASGLQRRPDAQTLQPMSVFQFRSVDETTQAMAFDGIVFQGQALKIRRPHDYRPLPGISEQPAFHVPGSSERQHVTPPALAAAVTPLPSARISRRRLHGGPGLTAQAVHRGAAQLPERRPGSRRRPSSLAFWPFEPIRP